MQPNRIGHAFAKPPVTFSEIRKRISHLCHFHLLSMAHAHQYSIWGRIGQKRVDGRVSDA